MWGGCGPAVLHLLAISLQQLLFGAVGMATRFCHACVGKRGVGLSWLLLVTGVMVLPLCSSLGLLLASLATLVHVSR
jgi:hypothetical protein